jgi:hypothetical protein
LILSLLARTGDRVERRRFVHLTDRREVRHVSSKIWAVGLHEQMKAADLPSGLLIQRREFALANS